MFYGGWGVVAVAVVVILVLTAGRSVPFGPSGSADYVGSQVPTGTNFSFLFSESIALYAVAPGVTPANETVVVTVWGNWSATALTSVSLSVNGVSPACPAPWGCFGQPGTGSGSLGQNVTIHPASGLGLPADGFTVALVFWATGQDTVRALSPLYAVATS